MPVTSRNSEASTHENGARKYASSSRRKMILIARIGPSDEADERALELAAREVELEQIELGLDDRAAHLGAAVLARRERERDALRGAVQVVDLRDAVHRAEDLLDRRLRVVGRLVGRLLVLVVVLDVAAVRVAALGRRPHEHR